jgi:hypothetical protein
VKKVANTITARKIKGPAHFVQRIKTKIQTQSAKWKTYLADLHERDIATIQQNGFGWPMRRNLREHYNPIFGPALAKFFGTNTRFGLADTLMHNLKVKKGKALEILEDGAGEGLAISELVETMRKSGVKVNATAIGLAKNPALEAQAKKMGIQVYAGPAELFVPKKPVDAIISLFGSIYFNPANFNAVYLGKEHLEKFAYSLKPNGILMAGVKAQYAKGKHKEMTPEQTTRFLQNLAQTFRKRNFKVGIFPFNDPNVEGQKPTHIIILQRLPGVKQAKQSVQ